MKLNNFKNKNILIVGDAMLDHYISGDAERISDEAPIPIVKVKKDVFLPGGAGNVAANIVTLGGKAFLISPIGNDEAGKILKRELLKRKIIVKAVPAPSTIRKIRVIARGQQLVRIDYEPSGESIKAETISILNQFTKKRSSAFDAFIISDYTKSAITKETAGFLIELAKRTGKPIVVDTKPSHWKYFKNAFLLTPNHKEAEAMSGTKNIKKAGHILQKELKANILITQGENGMTLFEGKDMFHLPTKAREVFDVTGAGDTVVSTVTLALASGHSLKEAAEIANHAASIVVGKIGTATASLQELKREINGI